MPRALANLLLLLVLVLSMGCGAGNSESAGAGNPQGVSAESVAYGSKTLDRLEQEYQQMLDVLQLNETEAKALEEVHRLHLGNLQSWFADNGPEIAALRRMARRAAEQRDLAKLKRMDAEGGKQQAAEWAAEEKELLQTYQRELEAALTEEQTLRWQAHVVAEQLLEWLQPLNVGPEQVQAIREEAVEVIAQLDQQQRKETWRGHGTANLEKRFGSDLINGDQKLEYENLRRRDRGRYLRWSQ